jgi:acyl carrier protein
MEEKILSIINLIRASKEMPELTAVSPNDNLRNDLGFSSFDLAELTVRIEDEFGIDIFENGLINTVGEIMESIKQ